MNVCESCGELERDCCCERPKLASYQEAFDMEGWRFLRAGEIILAVDEYLDDTHGWRKPLCVGEAAPDPSYPAHRIYRRATR